MKIPGGIIAGKYRLERVLGRGGMGMVVEATHVGLGTAFALKVLYKNIVANKSMAERFLREARATATLKGEHVCRVFDVGAHEGLPYLVMERLEGSDLAKVLRAAGRLEPATACDYLLQACAGLVEAHAAQIVHRDLKPGNLFLTARPSGEPLIKVLDFGIAKAPQDDDGELTGINTLLGSPAYMSPEQLRSSKQVDARTDIWSLGVILFELVAGGKPFAGEGVAELAVRLAATPVPRLPDGPAALDEVIARCLSRDPAQRYQDVGGLAQALAPFAGDPARCFPGLAAHPPFRTAVGVPPGVHLPWRRTSGSVSAQAVSGGAPAGTGRVVPLPGIPPAPATLPLAGAPAGSMSTAPMLRELPVRELDQRPSPVGTTPPPPTARLGTAPPVAARLGTAPPVAAGAPVTARLGTAPPVAARLGTAPPVAAEPDMTRLSSLQTVPVLRLERRIVAPCAVEPSPPPLPDAATTMQSIGVIESAAVPGRPRPRVGVIVLSAASVLGIFFAVMTSREEGPPPAAASARVLAPVPAAKLDAGIPADAPDPLDAGAPPDVALPVDAGHPAAAATPDDPGIEMEPSAGPRSGPRAAAPSRPSPPSSKGSAAASRPAPPPPAPPTAPAAPAPPAKRKTSAKSNLDNLRKLRI